MPLQTTVIGSFPKPSYLDVPDWFQCGTGGQSANATRDYSKLLANQSEVEKAKLEESFIRATKEVIDIQNQCGICVVTDGEVRRENYIHYLCRFIEGIDFDNLTETSVRNGAYTTHLPTVKGKVTWKEGLDVVAEWKKAQDVSPVPVKYTLPGPMTIIGTVHNAFYESERELAEDLSIIVNKHVRALAAAGCKEIQVDEPVFARQPDKALDYGVRLLDKCFEGVGSECHKTMHMCCGYPEYLDQENYLKADMQSYTRLAKAVDDSCIDAVSIEDAHRPNDLKLLEQFQKTTVILGTIKVASSKVETVDEIQDRIRDALDYIPADRLIIAPDCGLALLPLPILKQKLANMCSAAQACGCKKQKTAESSEVVC